MGLRSYIITRLILTIPMIMLLLSMAFLIIRVLPGDPVELHFEKKATPEAMEAMRRKLGLDKPLPVQYFEYLGGLLHGDLGKSMQDFSSVGEQLFSAFPATLELAIYSMLIAVCIGILLGVRSSQSYNSLLDHLIRGFGIVTYAIPIFLLGMIFQLIFGVYLHWLPIGLRLHPSVDAPTGLNVWGLRISTGLYTIDSLLEGSIFKFLQSLRSLFLPSLTLGLILCGIFIRLTRTNMLETLRLDFVTAAKARGLKETAVLYGYALRNAFLPILTMMGMQFAILLGGAILTETTFSWPGIGRYVVDRINFRDYTAIQGAIVVFGLLVALVSLIVDILYAYLDPRIRF